MMVISMDTHFKELESYIPDLHSRSMLDLGAGRGKFLFTAKKVGIKLWVSRSIPSIFPKFTKKKKNFLCQ